jgi:hypothetical protein
MNHLSDFGMVHNEQNAKDKNFKIITVQLGSLLCRTIITFHGGRILLALSQIYCHLQKINTVTSKGCKLTKNMRSLLFGDVPFYH